MKLQFLAGIAQPGTPSFDFLLVRGTNLQSDFQVNLFGQVTSNQTGSVKFVFDNIFVEPVPGAKVRLRNPNLREELGPLLAGLLREHPQLTMGAAADLLAIVNRDPACHSVLEPLLFYKGFLAITTYRVSHYLWGHDRRALALCFRAQGHQKNCHHQGTGYDNKNTHRFEEGTLLHL